MKRLHQLLKPFFLNLQSRNNRILVVFFLVIFLLLLSNAFHESYPDEFDNILGGWNILHGILIYRDFFTHHGPVAYFLSAMIAAISGQSFVAFRIVFSCALFIYFLFTYQFIVTRFGWKRTVFYLVFLLTISVAGNFYWFHMLLADTLSMYFLTPVVALLLLSSVYKRSLTQHDILFISVLVAMTILSSLTFLYLSFLLYGLSLYLIGQPFSKRAVIPKLVRASLLFIAPFVLYGVYLLITSSFGDYIYDAITFNQRYYIYNYPRPEGSTSINPIRFAIVIAHNFYNSYYTILQQLKDINIAFPLNITFAVGTFGTILYFFFKKYYILAMFFIGTIIYANGRSDPLTSKETDYQSAVYIGIAMLVIPFLLIKLFEEMNSDDEKGKKLLYSILFVLVGFYSVFSSLFLIQRFFNKAYDKYMGKAPLIYDRPIVAPIINSISKKDEKVWIGPFAFEELFYTEARPASKYQIFIPGMGAATELHQPFITEFEKTKPAVIYFQHDFPILGTGPVNYGQFFIRYLNEKYILLSHYEKNGVMFQSVTGKHGFLDLDNRLYLRREKSDEMVKRMIDARLIREKEYTKI